MGAASAKKTVQSARNKGKGAQRNEQATPEKQPGAKKRGRAGAGKEGAATKRRVRTAAESRLAWWREARFGMFIHWGLYAVPAGRWKGKDVPGIGEWIMSRARIPVAEYEKLAARFNPVRFDAEEWVRVARDAGMKYLVITAKHHDGFAMYDSPASDYNIVKATPYGRDPMKALARACRKAGIRLCFYYSQDQDWHHPDARGNNWDYDDAKKDFARYLREKVKPQVRELLTQYGPIGLIWFDTPGWITRAQSLDLKRFVHRLQPDCLVSGRVGHGVGDYGSLGDNQSAGRRIEGAWETPATLNHTWGYKSKDHDWKSVKTLLTLLVDLASKGVNYLLNVGPTAQGVIPAPSVARLRRMGEWMRVNGEAVYGTSAGPYPCDLQNVRMTQKPGRLYLHFLEWPGRACVLPGLKAKVTKAWLLADRGRAIRVEQKRDEALGMDLLELHLPGRAPDKNISVVALEVEGPVATDERVLQQPAGDVWLQAWQARLHTPRAGRRMSIDLGGVTQNWFTRGNRLSWEFTIRQPGRFEAQLYTAAAKWPRVWTDEGHKVRFSLAGKSFVRPVRADEMPRTLRSAQCPEALTRLGTVELDKPGRYRAQLGLEELGRDSKHGLQVSAVRLVPA